MPYQYSCFISYYRGRFDTAKGFVDELRKALEPELDLYTRKPVFFDERSIGQGQRVLL